MIHQHIMHSTKDRAAAFHDTRILVPFLTKKIATPSSRFRSCLRCMMFFTRLIQLVSEQCFTHVFQCFFASLHELSCIRYTGVVLCKLCSISKQCDVQTALQNTNVFFVSLFFSLQYRFNLIFRLIRFQSHGVLALQEVGGSIPIS